jgi:ABC-type multidrug transport system permease subunit
MSKNAKHINKWERGLNMVLFFYIQRRNYMIVLFVLAVFIVCVIGYTCCVIADTDKWNIPTEKCKYI